jgi:hypothetical protein
MPLISNVAAAVKIKQKILGFKFDDKTIYAWFCEDLKPFTSSSLLLLKKKAQNNFGHIQHKNCQVQAEDGKSQRISSNLTITKPTQSKPTKSKRNQPTTAALPPSISSTHTIESHLFWHYLIKDFLYTNVGDSLLLQIALNHPNFASYSSLYKNSDPKPLQNNSGCTFLQLPCVVTLNPCQAQLLDGTLNCHDVQHLLLGNGNGSIGDFEEGYHL